MPTAVNNDVEPQPKQDNGSEQNDTIEDTNENSVVREESAGQPADDGDKPNPPETESGGDAAADGRPQPKQNDDKGGSDQNQNDDTNKGEETSASDKGAVDEDAAAPPAVDDNAVPPKNESDSEGTAGQPRTKENSDSSSKIEKGKSDQNQNNESEETSAIDKDAGEEEAPAGKPSGDGKDSTSPPNHPLTGISKPGTNDVLFGRATGGAGNLNFSQMVGSKMCDIPTELSDKSLMELALELVKQWRAINPPGRFIEEDKDTQLWNDVGDERAGKQIAELIRDITKSQVADVKGPIIHRPIRPDQRHPLTGIRKPGPNDVIFGRGGAGNHNPGNKRYRQMVGSKWDEYKSREKHEKGSITLDLVKQWRALDPPGRFIEKDEITKLWHDVGDKRARKKISALMRDITKSPGEAVEAEGKGKTDNNQDEVMKKPGTDNGKKKKKKKKGKKKVSNEQPVNNDNDGNVDPRFGYANNGYDHSSQMMDYNMNPAAISAAYAQDQGMSVAMQLPPEFYQGMIYQRRLYEQKFDQFCLQAQQRESQLHFQIAQLKHKLALAGGFGREVKDEIILQNIKEGQTFESEEEYEKAIENYANLKHYDLRRQKFLPNIRFVCARALKPCEKHRQRCGCEFKISAKVDPITGFVRITKLSLDHTNGCIGADDPEILKVALRFRSNKYSEEAMNHLRKEVTSGRYSEDDVKSWLVENGHPETTQQHATVIHHFIKTGSSVSVSRMIAKKKRRRGDNSESKEDGEETEKPSKNKKSRKSKNDENADEVESPKKKRSRKKKKDQLKETGKGSKRYWRCDVCLAIFDNRDEAVQHEEKCRGGEGQTDEEKLKANEDEIKAGDDAEASVHSGDDVPSDEEKVEADEDGEVGSGDEGPTNDEKMKVDDDDDDDDEIGGDSGDEGPTDQEKMNDDEDEREAGDDELDFDVVV